MCPLQATSKSIHTKRMIPPSREASQPKISNRLFSLPTRNKVIKPKKSGMVLKLTPDYGFFEHKDFIKKNEAEWEKFEKAIDE